MKRRRKTFGQLLKAKRLTPAEKRRLTSLKAAYTRSLNNYTIQDLQGYVFGTLGEAEQYRLRQYWATRKTKKKVRRDALRDALKQLKAQLEDSSMCGEPDGPVFKWFLRTTGEPNQRYLELRVEPDGWADPRAISEAMATIDERPLKKIPYLLSVALVRYEVEGRIKKKDKRQVVVADSCEGRMKFYQEWKFIDYAQRGDICWSQTIGSLETVEQQYKVNQVVAIAFTWYRPDKVDKTKWVDVSKLVGG